MKSIFRDAHQSFSSVMPPVTRFLFYMVAIGYVITNLLFIVTSSSPLLADITSRAFFLLPRQAVYQFNAWQFFTHPVNGGSLGIWEIISIVFHLLILFQFGSMIEGQMRSRRYAWYIGLVVVLSAVFYAVYALLLGGVIPLFGADHILSALFVFMFLYFPRMEVNFWGIPMQMRLLILVFGILLALGTLQNISKMGFVNGLQPTLASIAAIPISVIILKTPGLLDRMEGMGPRGRRRKKANVVKLGMGHPGRHTDADDLYDDPHWKLDQ